MGTPVAVMYANIVVFQIERNYVRSAYCYMRFLDDVYAIKLNRTAAELYITNFNSVCPSIQFEPDSVTIGDSGIFLDTISKIVSSHCGQYCMLRISVYQKPQNRYMYLTPASQHAPVIFKNFVTEEFKRYRLYCNNTADFLDTCRKFTSRLQARGYNREWIAQLFTTISNRTTLLTQLFSPTPPAKKVTGPVMVISRVTLDAIQDLRRHLALPDTLTHQRDYEHKFKGLQTLFALSNPPSLGSRFTTSIYPRPPPPRLQPPPHTTDTATAQDQQPDTTHTLEHSIVDIDADPGPHPPKRARPNPSPGRPAGQCG